MHLIRAVITALLSVLFLNGCQLAVSAAPADEQIAALHALFDDAWERRLRENPTFASNLGDLRWNDQWGDASLEAIEARHRATEGELERLRGISRDTLPPAERLNYDLFEQRLANDVAAHRYRDFLMPISQRGGVQTLHNMTETLRLDTTRHYEDWLARLASVDTLIDQNIALMRAGIEEGRVRPRVIMERVPSQLAAHLVNTPDESPFFKPFERYPDGVPAPDRARLTAAARETIADTVIPAYRRLAQFFNEEYLPATRTTVGAWDLPEGREYYGHRARVFTTTSLTPDEIHEIGVAEVERIRAQMMEVIEAVGFERGFDAFLDHLRTDPQFYFDDGDELLTAYRAMSKRIDPLMVQLFGRLPRMPYGVRPIPMDIAPDTTTAYYSRPAADGSRAGNYYVNIYRPEVRPKYEMMALSLHEAVPGHHLQIALAQELGDLPNFRRYGGFTAFSEGWGLYAEYLGEELGLYDDPYDKFGQLTYEMWRAVRLVVDTGMHHKGWTRERAIEFFMANAAKSEADIINEIDRYIANPGQALAYKIGELKLKELRRRAEQRLGDRFDVRAFHDAVLENGAVPLDVLERHIDAWIEERASA
ncbi:MAG: DUF885 domain-containing protein [Xanthomonadaceae bacterium]|nr:DUF885 domain-containing protein [Xanthomonadaceae bacterium]